MNFIEKLLGLMKQGLQAVIDTIVNMFSFLFPVFEFIFSFFYGIFYLIFKLGNVLWYIIRIITALVQFFASIVIGLFRTIFSFLNPTYVKPSNVSTDLELGISVTMQLFENIGVMNVFPLIMLVFVWLGFVLAVINLFKRG